jgi:hypothetical protein
MYSLKCDYYKKEFNYLHELVDDVLMSGMDPDYEITKNGVGMNEKVKPFHDATTSFFTLSKSIYKKLRTPRPPRVNIGGGG